MVTYLNEHFQRVAVTNEEDIKTYYEVDEKLDALTEEEFNKAVDIISNYTWDGGVANTNRIRGLANRLGVFYKDLEMWYWLED